MDNSYQNPNQGGYYQPPQPPPIPPTQNYYQAPNLNQSPSSNAILALVFGILSWILCGPFLGIPAWIIGKIEVNKIDRGESSQTGRGLATGGMWLGIINTILYILLILLIIALAIIGVLADKRYRYNI